MLPGTFNPMLVAAEEGIEVYYCGYAASGSSSVGGNVTIPPPKGSGRLLVATTTSQRDAGSASIGGIGMTNRRFINNSWTDVNIWSVLDDTLSGTAYAYHNPSSSGSNSTWIAIHAIYGLKSGGSLIQNAGGGQTTSAHLSAAKVGDVAMVYGGYRSASWSAPSGYTRSLGSRHLSGFKIIESDGTAYISNGISSSYEYTFASSLFR